MYQKVTRAEALEAVRQGCAEPVVTPTMRAERKEHGVRIEAKVAHSQLDPNLLLLIPANKTEANHMAMVLRLAARHMDMLAKSMEW